MAPFVLATSTIWKMGLGDSRAMTGMRILPTISTNKVLNALCGFKCRKDWCNLVAFRAAARRQAFFSSQNLHSNMHACATYVASPATTAKGTSKNKKNGTISNIMRHNFKWSSRKHCTCGATLTTKASPSDTQWSESARIFIKGTTKIVEDNCRNKYSALRKADNMLTRRWAGANLNFSALYMGRSYARATTVSASSSKPSKATARNKTMQPSAT
mmetsp:Transcript_86480/g.249793  ORF Transcript_86480/g.249793 Transcript_86480/m.249793 type:complete len:215 (-) Transcript_86480:13-657(-)